MAILLSEVLYEPHGDLEKKIMSKMPSEQKSAAMKAFFPLNASV